LWVINDALRLFDGIDFIWQEIHQGVIERWLPAYAPYLHRFFMSAAREHWSDIMSYYVWTTVSHP
jgi:hypothetical protein